MKHKTFIYFFLTTELFLVINEPYAFMWIIPFPSLIVSAVIYLLFLLLIWPIVGKSGRSLPGVVQFGLLITMITWFFYYVFFSDPSYITRIALLVITYLFLTCLYQKEDDFFLFWKYNNRFILLQAFLSTICFVLVAVGLLSPLISFSPDGTFREFYFWGGCFSKTYLGRIIRPSGFLDEPGALAAWAVFGILFNYAFVKDNLIKKFLPFFALPTLSAAYIVQMGGFLLLKNIKKIQNMVSVTIVVFVLIWGVSLTKGTDFDVYAKTIGRFMVEDETGLVESERQSHMDNAIELFNKAPLMGVGAQTFSDYSELVADNPYEILAKDGIIGYIISYLPLIMILFINRRKEVLICLIIIFAGYQQRPLHINFMHDMYLWSFLLFAVIDAKEQKRCKMSQQSL